METVRRKVLLALAGAPFIGYAQEAFPSRPIHLIVTLGAGGPTDVVARMMGLKMSATLGVPVVVENRVGAGGQIALQAVARSPADGYTLLVTTSGQALLPVINKTFTVDMLKQLTSVAHFFSGSVAFTSSAHVPVNTLQEFVAYAKANPGKLNYAAQGVSDLLAVELFKSMTGIRAETIRYNGGAQAVLAVLSGESHFTFASPGAIKSHAAAGKVKVLATTGLTRSRTLPDTPTVAESVAPGFEYLYWVGLTGPANMPDPVVQRIYAAAMDALRQPDINARLLELGYEAAKPSGSEAMGRLIESDLTKWQQAAREAGFQPT